MQNHTQKVLPISHFCVKIPKIALCPAREIFMIYYDILSIYYDINCPQYYVRIKKKTYEKLYTVLNLCIPVTIVTGNPR